MLLGCIGDDFTGSSDLANTLTKGGMRTVQYNGIPTEPAATDVDAGVVALKTRSVPVNEAVSQSLAALRWLRDQGCQQFVFKYCSTFDSTPQGNIGPVAEALADEVGAGVVVFCPAFPATGRAVFQGHLFVNDSLLNESGMESHPLTPMTDPDIRRCLARQTGVAVGHVPLSDVRAGDRAIAARLEKEQELGHRFVIADATEESDLFSIGQALAQHKLVTGGSGIALGLPENFRKRGALREMQAEWRGQPGQAVVLSGSCSRATREQVRRFIDQGAPSREILASEVMDGTANAQTLADWVRAQGGKTPIIYSSADPEVVAKAQEAFGKDEIAAAFENLFSELSRELVAAGLSRLITAGGETSGAVVSGLKLEALSIGPEIAPGVPALRAGENLVLTLKSGNFGGPDFFTTAAAILAGERAA